MAALRTMRQIPVGSISWISNERNQMTQFVDQENEDFSMSARNEIDWLNEHMAEIFNEEQLNVTEVFKTPAKLRGKTQSNLLRQLNAALPKNTPDANGEVKKTKVEEANAQPSLLQKPREIQRPTKPVQSMASKAKPAPVSIQVDVRKMSQIQPPGRSSLYIHMENQRKLQEKFEAERNRAVQQEVEKRQLLQKQKDAEKLEMERKRVLQQKEEKRLREQREAEQREWDRRRAFTQEAEKKLQLQKEADRRQQLQKEAEKREWERKRALLQQAAEKKKQLQKEAEEREQLQKQAEKREAERKRAIKHEAEKRQQLQKEAEKREAERRRAVQQEAEKRQELQKEAEKREFERRRAFKQETEKRQQRQLHQKEAEIERKRAIQREAAKRQPQHQRKEVERKRAAQLEDEKRLQQQQQQRETERLDGRERALIFDDPKILIHKQAIERRRLENAQRQKAAAASLRAQPAGQPSKIPPPAQKLGNTWRPLKRPLQTDQIDQPVQRPTDVQEEPPVSHQHDEKRRRMDIEDYENISLPDIPTDSEDEDPEKRFKPPAWACSPELQRLLLLQESVDPETIFGPIQPVDLDEMFPDPERPNRWKHRTSSALWDNDRLTEEEIRRDRVARERIRKNGGWNIHVMDSPF